MSELREIAISIKWQSNLIFAVFIEIDKTEWTHIVTSDLPAA